MPHAAEYGAKQIRLVVAGWHPLQPVGQPAVEQQQREAVYQRPDGGNAGRMRQRQRPAPVLIATFASHAEQDAGRPLRRVAQRRAVEIPP